MSSTATRRDRGALFVLAAGALLLGAGCASLPSGQDAEMGVRAGFEKTHVGSVAVFPVVAADPFGLTRAEREAMEALYSEESVHALTKLGAKVLTPSQVMDALVKAGRVGELRTRLDLDRPLQALFEVEEVSARRLEDDRKVFVREMKGVLGVDAVLLGQVVYHTTGRCAAGDESPYTEHVALTGELVTTKGDVPCAVSNFQAKLIDTETGLTIWHNRALRELRAVKPDEPTPDPAVNAAATVRLTIAETSSGLARLVRAPGQPGAGGEISRRGAER